MNTLTRALTLTLIAASIGNLAMAADPPAAPHPFKSAQRISDATLNEIAGRANLSQTVNARNSSNVANNSVGDQSTTGTITFDGHAFQDLRGLSVLSANTGNNVSINASLNVNVALSR